MDHRKISLTSYRTIQTGTEFDVVAVEPQDEKASNALELERIVPRSAERRASKTRP